MGHYLQMKVCQKNVTGESDHTYRGIGLWSCGLIGSPPIVGSSRGITINSPTHYGHNSHSHWLHNMERREKALSSIPLSAAHYSPSAAHPVISCTLQPIRCTSLYQLHITAHTLHIPLSAAHYSPCCTLQPMLHIPLSAALYITAHQLQYIILQTAVYYYMPTIYFLINLFITTFYYNFKLLKWGCEHVNTGCN